MRRGFGLFACAALVATAASISAVAGGPTEQLFDVAQGLVVNLGPDTDALSSAAPASATRRWWANYQNQGAAAVTNATVTISSGYPASALNANGAPVTALPAGFGAASIPAGAGIFIGIGSTLPATGTPAFDSSRSVDIATVPLAGAVQTTTVTVTLTDPIYAANGRYTKVSIESQVPGASVASTIPPVLVAGETVQTFGKGPSGRTFALHQGVLGVAYAFTIAFAVPNPYGAAFAHKPAVSILYAYQPPEVLCTTCTTGASLAVGTLDGPTPGAGSMSVSIDQTSTWRTSTTTTFSAVYAPLASPPPLPPLPLCATLADCPFEGPSPVTSGLASPNAIATDRHGDLYLSEKPTHDTATLSVLRVARDDADDEDRDEDATTASGKTELFRVSAAAPFTAPTIGSPSFDAAGNAYVVVSQHVTGELLHVRRAIVRLDRRSHRAEEIFVAEGLDPALGQPASAGIAVDRDGTVYFGRSNALYRLTPGATPVAIATFATSARIASWPLIEKDGSLVIIVQDGTLSAIYSIRRNGAVVLVAQVQANTPGATGFGNLGADAAGNVFTMRRVAHGFRRFSCAVSTTIHIYRLEGLAVRTSSTEVVPTEIGRTTQAGHLGLTGSDPAFFRVTPRGDVFVGVYPFVAFCPPTPLPAFPLSNQTSARRLMGFVAQADGSARPYLLLDLPGLPADPDADHFNFGALAFALRHDELLVSNAGAGDVVRFQRDSQVTER